MANARNIEMKLPSLDELFSSQEERDDAKLKRIIIITIAKGSVKIQWASMSKHFVIHKKSYINVSDYLLYFIHVPAFLECPLSTKSPYLVCVNGKASCWLPQGHIPQNNSVIS